MAEAAERRAGAEENRGVKDASSVKRMEQKRDELEKRQNEQVGQDDTALKVCFYMSQLYFVIIWYIYCFRMKVNKRKTCFVRGLRTLSQFSFNIAARLQSAEIKDRISKHSYQQLQDVPLLLICRIFTSFT